MAYFTDQSTNTGVFVPTTNVWDIQDIESTDVTSDAFKQLFVRLYQNVNQIALALNTKVSGYAINQEFLTGGLFYNPASNEFPRPVFRQVISMGTLPPSTLRQVPHGLPVAPVLGTSATFSFVAPLAGVASKIVATPFLYAPIPYSYASGGIITANIELWCDATYVNVKSGATTYTFDTCYVTLEYVK